MLVLKVIMYLLLFVNPPCPPFYAATTPMGQLPILNYKGQDMIQSMTIARFVARKCGLAGSTEIEEFLCDQVSQMIKG